jgi:hypothetical protein
MTVHATASCMAARMQPVQRLLRERIWQGQAFLGSNMRDLPKAIASQPTR